MCVLHPCQLQNGSCDVKMFGLFGIVYGPALWIDVSSKAIFYFSVCSFPQQAFSWCFCRRPCTSNWQTTFCGAGPWNHGGHFWWYSKTSFRHQQSDSKYLHPQRSKRVCSEQRYQMGVCTFQKSEGRLWRWCLNRSVDFWHKVSWNGIYARFYATAGIYATAVLLHTVYM